MIHPDRPAPVEQPDIEFRSIVLEKQGEQRSFIAMERDDAAELGEWMTNVLGYVKKTNNLLCYYRKDLKEPMCVMVEEKEAGD